MRGITFYAKNSGVEVIGDNAVRKDKKYGAVTLRFFKFQDGGASMRFIMNPIEAFSASISIKSVANSTNPAKKSLTHTFEKDGQEITTVLTFEKWARDGKSGYAAVIQRDDQSINVPMDTATFLYLKELLKYLSTQQAWVNPLEPAEEGAEGAEAEDPFAGFEAAEEIEEIVEEVEAENEPEPVAKNPFEGIFSNASGNDDSTVSNGETFIIEAVRRDGKGFKANGQWFTITDRSEVEAELKKGTSVKIESRVGDNGVVFANKVIAA